MRYLSVCSGIEAATCAWHDLGFTPVAFSEIEKFPCAVLAHHYPAVPNWGDMTKFKEWPNETVDLLVGGTPCQSFSVAGLRKGLEDPRGNLMLTFLGIADKYKPQWIVWENVPGVLSSNKGRDFGTFLGALAELGYGWAYRVLDAQFFGVPQRRRRVFVVGCFGDWRSAASVLFEPESLRRDLAPRRKTGQNVTETAGTLASSGGGLNRPAGNANELDFCVVSTALRAKANSSHRADTEAYIPAISGAVCAREYKGPNSSIDQGTPLIAFYSRQDCISGTKNFGALGSSHPQAQAVCVSGEISHTLTKRMDGSEDGTGRGTPIVAVHENQRSEVSLHETMGALKCNGGKPGQGYPCIAIQDGREIEKKQNGLGVSEGPSYTIDQTGGQAVAFTQNQSGDLLQSENCPSMGTNQNATGRNTPKVMIPKAYSETGPGFISEGIGVIRAEGENRPSRPTHTILSGMSVRRLTPRECERLQGFPDDWTLIPWRKGMAPDGPRYKALGNSMAVPVMRWIGGRIMDFDDY